MNRPFGNWLRLRQTEYLFSLLYLYFPYIPVLRVDSAIGDREVSDKLRETPQEWWLFSILWCMCLFCSQPCWVAGLLDPIRGTQEIPGLPGSLGSVMEKSIPYLIYIFVWESVSDNSEDIQEGQICSWEDPRGFTPQKNLELINFK